MPPLVGYRGSSTPGCCEAGTRTRATTNLASYCSIDCRALCSAQDVDSAAVSNVRMSNSFLMWVGDEATPLSLLEHVVVNDHGDIPMGLLGNPLAASCEDHLQCFVYLPVQAQIWLAFSEAVPQACDQYTHREDAVA